MAKTGNPALKLELFKAYARFITPLSVHYASHSEEIILHRGMKISRVTRRGGSVEVYVEDTTVGDRYSRIENQFIINALIKAADEVGQQQTPVAAADKRSVEG